MSRRVPGIVLFVLSLPLLLLGITAWREADRETGVRAWQLEQSRTVADPAERERFVGYAESTQWRIDDAEYNRTMLLAAGAAGMAGGVVVLATARRRREFEPAEVKATGAVGTAAPRFTACEACGRQISVAATACPQCGHPHRPEPVAVKATPPEPVDATRRAFYATLIALGLGSAMVIYTVLFDSLSETVLVRISPLWIFPIVFGYYGLVAQRMQARLQETHLDTVSDQLLDVIKESHWLGRVFAFLLYAPFLLVKSRQPWVTALVGSLIWAIALALFFSVIFPTL
ncbi:hypothetical protein Ait01nite_035050 [Actinoplanes italicus]|uniref:Zinc ribbon protein n=1 Tax=Actinoplanes italicus TaxID=113567 RepID=A0A2T0K8X6_9ACTN|nr:zinc ribbon domain-containing protein [Actinoplanes italicus]PRX19525.1 hypothetical protein CLV67_110277 [Actinoplanes italicus]GIE30460.1 hypothetical protein Ait01nite_035050 [Actinoplanes italicus]